MNGLAYIKGLYGLFTNTIIIYLDNIKAMKGSIPELLLIMSITIWRTAQVTCNKPFTQVSNYVTTYCVKCDSTCDTCFDDSVSGCVTCIDDFNLN